MRTPIARKAQAEKGDDLGLRDGRYCAEHPRCFAVDSIEEIERAGVAAIAGDRRARVELVRSFLCSPPTVLIGVTAPISAGGADAQRRTMTRQRTQLLGRPGKRWHWSAALVAAVLTLGTTTLAVAQAPVAEPVPAAVKPLSAEELEKLVAPFALYPDDLVALILPASTVPIEVILAERYLEERKKDASKPVPTRFSDPVKSLLNYPIVRSNILGRVAKLICSAP